jgi:hypothetical protein
LALASGGTGANTQPAAANAILPTQTGNVGFILKTDGSNVSWIDPASVSVSSWSGGTTGLLPSAATAGAVVVTGTLNIANGGTGQVTANAALNALLPDQTGQAGKFLTTTGADAAWAVPSAAATLTEAQAGTLNTVFSSPLTSVPKDASGMTGAAIIPSGTTAQQPGTPGNGWLRYNSTYPTNNVEVYSAATTSWRPLAYAQQGTVYPDLNVPAGTTITLPASLNIYNNVTIAGTLNVTNASEIRAVGTVTITGAIVGSGTGVPGALGIQLSANNRFFTGYQGRNIGGGAYAGASTSAALATGYVWTASLLGSSGGSGGISTEGGFGNGLSAPGGASGASLLVEAEGAISFTGTCDFSGQTPSVGFAQLGCATGGSGGGSGGAFVLISNTSINLGGTINVAGGNGSDANSTGTQGNGGGGGGGGWVVVQSPSNTVTATINKAGGLTGFPNSGGVPNILGGNGGSFAGNGGQAGVDAYGLVTQNGSAGYLSNNGVLS